MSMTTNKGGGSTPATTTTTRRTTKHDSNARSSGRSTSRRRRKVLCLSCRSSICGNRCHEGVMMTIMLVLLFCVHSSSVRTTATVEAKPLQTQAQTRGQDLLGSSSRSSTDDDDEVEKEEDFQMLSSSATREATAAAHQSQTVARTQAQAGVETETEALPSEGETAEDDEMEEITTRTTEITRRKRRTKSTGSSTTTFITSSRRWWSSTPMILVGEKKNNDYSSDTAGTAIVQRLPRWLQQQHQERSLDEEDDGSSSLSTPSSSSPGSAFLVLQRTIVRLSILLMSTVDGNEMSRDAKFDYEVVTEGHIFNAINTIDGNDDEISAENGLPIQLTVQVNIAEQKLLPQGITSIIQPPASPYGGSGGQRRQRSRQQRQLDSSLMTSSKRWLDESSQLQPPPLLVTADVRIEYRSTYLDYDTSLWVQNAFNDYDERSTYISALQVTNPNSFKTIQAIDVCVGDETICGGQQYYDSSNENDDDLRIWIIIATCGGAGVGVLCTLLVALWTTGPIAKKNTATSTSSSSSHQGGGQGGGGGGMQPMQPIDNHDIKDGGHHQQQQQYGVVDQQLQPVIMSPLQQQQQIMYQQQMQQQQPVGFSTEIFAERQEDVSTLTDPYAIPANMNLIRWTLHQVEEGHGGGGGEGGSGAEGRIEHHHYHHHHYGPPPSSSIPLPPMASATAIPLSPKDQDLVGKNPKEIEEEKKHLQNADIKNQSTMPTITNTKTDPNITLDSNTTTCSSYNNNGPVSM